MATMAEYIVQNIGLASENVAGNLGVIQQITTAIEGTAVTPVYNLLNFGVNGYVPGSGGDDTAAIIAWLTHAATSGGDHWMPAGNYNISAVIDFTVIFPNGSAYILNIICSPAAVITATANMTEMINLATTDTSTLPIEWSKIVLPVLNGNNKAANGVRMRNVEVCHVEIADITNFSGSGVGLFMDESGTPKTGVFNNKIIVRQISNCVTGLASYGNSAAANNGVQGNIIEINYIVGCANGVNIDANGVGMNSQLNTFNIGCVESCTSHGILDNNGNNTYIVGASDCNTVGFALEPGAKGIPTLIGNFTDPISVPTSGSNPMRIINSQAVCGKLTAPSMPASGTAQYNTFPQAVRIYLSGGTVTAVNLNIVATAGPTSGLFILQPGECIQVFYTSTPSWTWWGM